MNKKKIFLVLGALCIAASVIMYSLRNDSHLSELGDFFWAPLPLAILFNILGLKKDQTNN